MKLIPNDGVFLARWSTQYSSRTPVELFRFPPSNLYMVIFKSRRLFIAESDEEAVKVVQARIDAGKFDPERLRWTKYPSHG